MTKAKDLTDLIKEGKVQIVCDYLSPLEEQIVTQTEDHGFRINVSKMSPNILYGFKYYDSEIGVMKTKNGFIIYSIDYARAIRDAAVAEQNKNK